MRKTWDNHCLHQFLRSGEWGELRWCCVWRLMLFRLQKWISIASGKIKPSSKEWKLPGSSRSLPLKLRYASEPAGGVHETRLLPHSSTLRSGISRSGVGPGNLYNSCQEMLRWGVTRCHLEAYWLFFSQLFQPSSCTLMCVCRGERVCVDCSSHAFGSSAMQADAQT